MGRPWSPLGVRLAFWEGPDAGPSVAVAAQLAGVLRPTAYRWLSDHQKVLPSPFQDFSVPSAGLLSLHEREEIGFQLAQGPGLLIWRFNRSNAISMIQPVPDPENIEM